MLEVPPTYLEVPQKAITEETNTQIQRVQIQNYTNTGYGIPKLFAEYIRYHV